MGNWITLASGKGGASQAPVVAFTGSITGYKQWASAVEAVFGGVITRPADYSHLSVVQIFALSPDGQAIPLADARYVAPFSSTTAWSGSDSHILQTSADQPGWGLLLIPYDENYLAGTPTLVPSDYPTHSLTIAAATIASVTANDEIGMRWPDSATALHAVISFVAVGVSTLPSNLMAWIKKGTGSEPKERQGWDQASQDSGQATGTSIPLYIGAQRTDNGGTDITISASLTTGVVYPPTDADETWTLYVAPWSQAVADSGVCPVSAVSCTFTMHKTGAPAATGITNATCGPSTTMGPNSEGTPYWSVPISFTTPGMGTGGNQNCRGFAVTVNITDASGNEAPVEQGGGEVIMAEPPNDGSTWTPDPLVAGFNPAGSIYTYVQLKVYAPGLDVGDSWNMGTQTLQLIAWNGGSAVTSVLVNFGQPPDGAIPATRIDPSTMGAMLGRNSTTKKLEVKVTGPLYADVANNMNIAIASDFTVQGGVLTQAAVDLAKAVNFGGDFTKSGGIFAVNAIAVNKLLAGDALFYGQATFAYAGGGKVTINSSGIALANVNTGTPSATLTLTANGASIVGRGNTLALDPTGLTASDSSGNYLTLKTEGVRIVRGSTNMLLSATGVTLTDANGNSLTMDASNGVVVSHGTSSVTVAATGVTIVGGKLTSPTITGGSISGSSLTITTSNGTVSITPGSLGLTVVGGSYTSSISGGGFYTTGGITSTGVIAGGGINVTGSYAGYGVYCPNYAISANSLMVGVGGIDCHSAQISSQSLLIGGNTSINSSNQFVGFGVNVGTYGVMAGGYGIYGGYYGGTGSFVDQGGVTHQFRGGLILN